MPGKSILLCSAFGGGRVESDQLSYKMAADGGNEADKYEVGSNYLLLASGNGVCEF